MAGEDVKQCLFSYVDNHHDVYVQRLREAVAIKGVSTLPDQRPELIRQMHVTAEELRRLGGDVELCDVGKQTLADGSSIGLPPVILARFGNDPEKKTLLLYGHLDVQPAAKSDGWDQDPFTLTEKDGALYGRGATDDKGPVLAMINAVESFVELGIAFPVNIKMVFEGMEEFNSDGLEDLLHAKQNTFLKDVDYVCISDGNWLGQTRPCINYGLRGNCYFQVQVECARKDLHSGAYGGAVHEAMTDLIYLLGKVVDNRGQILIPGLNNRVLPLTDEELALYNGIEFNVEDYRKEIGTKKLIRDCKTDILMHTWRYPSLSLHGIEGAYSEPGCKTVIPRKVIGKFSIRIVPDQVPADINTLVVNYMKLMHEMSGSPNDMKVTYEHGAFPWLGDFKDEHFEAGKAAIGAVYGCEPDLTREGGTVPITLVLQDTTQKNVILLPMGKGDDGAHSQNEKFDKENYFNGIKMMIAYFFELSKLGGIKTNQN